MALFDIKQTLDVIRSNLLTTNYFGGVEVGEPKSAPADEKVKVYIWLTEASIPVMTGATTVELYVLNARIHEGLFGEPTADIETHLQEIYAKITEALLQNYTLDAEVRHIDVSGIYGTAYRGDWGHAEIDGSLFRIIDVTIPFIFDDGITLAP